MISIGQVISGKYRLLRLLGDGGMGSVYEAQHEVLGTRVAIKVLHADLARRPGLIERFLQEARVAAQIESVNVVRVSDVDRTPDGIAYIVMELLQGEPLSATLERDHKVSIATAVDYTKQILSALEAAHALGVTHRDLKPENVFLTFSGGKPVVKIIDFGIAKLRTPTTTGRNLTVAGVVMGTAEYMAPEQASSADKADARSDVYAVGVMLYELVSGERPVSGEDARLIAMKVERGEVKPLVHAAPDVPRELAGLVHRAMAARPEIRFQTATEMRLALEAVKISATPPVPPAEKNGESARPPTQPIAAPNLPAQNLPAQLSAPNFAMSAASPQGRPNPATVMAAPLAMDAYGAPPNTERPPLQQMGGTQSPYANAESSYASGPAYGAAPAQTNASPHAHRKKGGGWLLFMIPLLLGVGVVVTWVVVQSQNATVAVPTPTAGPLDTSAQLATTQNTAQNTANAARQTATQTATDTPVAPLLTNGAGTVKPPPNGHPTAPTAKPTETSQNPPTLPFPSSMPSGFPTAFPSTLPFPVTIPSGFPTAFPFPPPQAPAPTQTPPAPAPT